MKNKKNYYYSIIFFINTLLIIFGHVIFTESQKSWFALKIFTDNEGFLNLTFGPIYLYYLKIIIFFFDFPAFVKIELFITSSIYLYFFYKFLNIFFKNSESFLMIIPVLPMLLLVESRQNLLAAALILPYVIQIISKKEMEYFPISILISSMISRTFFPLLVLNFLFVFIFKNKIFFRKKIKKFIFITKFLLIMFFILTCFYQSKSKFNNHMLSDPIYVPSINLSNPVEIGFFQFNNQYLNDKIGESETDWLISFDKNYNKNNTIFKIFFNQPKILFVHLIKNIPKIIYESTKKIFGYILVYFDYSIKLIFLFFFLFFFIAGTIKLYKKYYLNTFFPILIYLIIFITTLLITNPTERYVSLIVPLIILPFYYSIKELLKKKFILFLLFFIFLTSFINYNYYFNHTKKNYQNTNLLKLFLDKFNDRPITIVTNEKTLMIALNINNKKFKYLGFDSLPPYFDSIKFYDVKNAEFIIYTDSAKSFDDISTKQGPRYHYYIQPFINNGAKVIRLGDFNIIKNF